MKKISVITGGHGGMGKAIARELGKETAIFLGDVNEEELKRVKVDLEETGIEVYIYVLDVTDAENVEGFASMAKELGEVVNVINTAGVSPALCNAQQIYKVNSIGTVNITEAFYKVISQGGVMINFGSVAAYQTDTDPEWIDVYEQYMNPDFYEKLMQFVAPLDFDEFLQAGNAYAISKRFVIYYTQKNVERFYGKGARILSVSPGSYLTPMHQALLDNQPDMAEDQLDLIPAGRWGHPYEIASLVHFLCSKGASYIAGVDILADGGQISSLFVPQVSLK